MLAVLYCTLLYCIVLYKVCWAPGGETIALAYCNTEYLAYHDRRIDTRWCDTVIVMMMMMMMIMMMMMQVLLSWLEALPHQPGQGARSPHRQRMLTNGSFVKVRPDVET